MKPSKVEWGIALCLFLFLFASWRFWDTTAIVGFQVDFADSMVHGEFSNPFQRNSDRGTWEKENNVEEICMRDISPYDLSVNLVLGIWGLPLYLLGGTDYASSFAKLLYGKSFFFFVFLISTWLVYKICRAIDLDDNKSKWAAFIYFTSSMAWHSICLVGNIDTLCITLTLAGVLAYIRGRDRECFVWFLLAFPFKQFAAFIYLPLLLLRDKNLFRDGFKLIAIAVVNTILSLPVLNCPGATARKSKFMLDMVYRLFQRTIPFLNREISIFVLLYVLLCAYCWLKEEPSEKRERNHMTLWAAMTAITITLSSIRNHPQWFLYVTPYMAAAVMYYAKRSDKILTFETVGYLSLLGYFYSFDANFYSPKYGKYMLLWQLFGKKDAFLPNDLQTALNVAGEAGKSSLDLFRVHLTSALGAIYTACVLVIIFWLCRPQNIDTECEINIRPYALPRMFLNALGCYIPLIYFIKVML